MAGEAVDRPSARERLLASASELFYREGVHSVGIDRVIEHADVAKATLYSAFGSKDGLIRAYLAARHAATREQMSRALAARYDNPRDRLLGVFDIQGEGFTNPEFRGCAFTSANAEPRPGSAVEDITEDYRTWLRALFTDLAVEAGATDPDGLARQLGLVYDGAGIAAWLDHDPGAARAARTVAEALVGASLPAGRRRAGTRRRASA